MPLGKEVDLGPGHIVLDGDPVGTQPPQQPLPTLGPCLLWPNGRPSQQLLSFCFIKRQFFTFIIIYGNKHKYTHAQKVTWIEYLNVTMRTAHHQ